RVEEDFVQFMEEDLNTVSAIHTIMQFVKKVNGSLDNKKELLQQSQDMIVKLMDVLGIQLGSTVSTGEKSLPSLIELLIELRSDLRQAKQYDLADKIRSSLSDLNIQLEDKPEGTIWKFK
ncbi:MAG: DALR domain-containing protein, partial [Candidatus Kariarchaeaceae archaeon]